MCDRALAPALEQLGQVGRHLAADEHEQPVAGLQARRAARQQRLVAAHDQRDERVARQPEIAQPRAGGGVARADHVLDDVRARARAPRRPRARTAGRSRLVGRDAQPARDRLDRRALQQGREQDREEHDVEELPRVGARRSITGKIASTTGTAPRRPGPAEQRLLAHGRSRCPSVDTARRQRPRDEDDHEREQRALPRDLVELVREHEQAEREEHRRAARPRRGPRGTRSRCAAPGGRPSRARAPRGRPRGSPSRPASPPRRTRARRRRARRPGRGPGVESRTRWNASRASMPDRRRRPRGRSRAAARTAAACRRSP